METQDRLGAGPFRLLRKIASGSSSTVYEALNVERGERVALKIFLPQITEDREWIARIHREAETLKSLRHPGIARLHGFWQLEDKAFLELEFIEGRTLAQVLLELDCPLLEPRLWIIAQIARALGGVHEEGIVHRDLKPENILLSDAGEVKLVDFGLAKSGQEFQTVTQAGSFVGSLAYMAPEVVRGERATMRSDLYAFGAIAWEVLCGKHPYKKENAQSLVRAILDDTAPDCRELCPQISEEIAAAIMSCLAKEPEERPESIWQVEALLMNALVSSGLMNFAKATFRKGAEPDLAAALQIRHAKLSAQIHQLILQPSQRKQAMICLNEFSRLFPNDPQLASWLKSLSVKAERKFARPSKKYAVVTLLVAGVSGIGVWFARGPSGAVDETTPPSVVSPPPQIHAPTVQTEVTPAIRAEPIEIAPEVSMTKPVENSRVTLKPPKKITTVGEKKPIQPAVTAKGFLKINVDPEVRVYVDGRRVSQKELSKLSLEVGRHQLLLERDGFLPIEESVVIQADKTVNINARGSNEN